jgi:urease accessory protein
MPALPSTPAPDLPTARCLLQTAPDTPPTGQVVLTHVDRAIRVRALTTVQGETFIVALDSRQSLNGCYGFVLEDGRCIQIIQAEETLLEITGDITRYAWHIGSLNLPCQIEGTRLLMQHNPQVQALLDQMGAKTRRISAPFSPEPAQHIAHNHSHSHVDPTPKGDPF